MRTKPALGFVARRTSLLTTIYHIPSVGTGHSPIAVGLGPSAGPLVVPDRRPVSPLSSPRTCSGAGPGRHGCGWIAVSAALSEGPAPWCWNLHLRSPLGRHRGGGSPAARGRNFPSYFFSSGWRRALLTSHWPLGCLPGCSSACRVAGPYRHCRLCGRAVGRVRAGTVAGGSPSAPFCLRVPSPAPWRWSLLVRCPLGRHCGGGSPSARGCAGHGDTGPVTGPGAACQLVRGQVDRKVGPGAAPGGHGHVHQSTGH